jgi:hypothetical protein
VGVPVDPAPLVPAEELGAVAEGRVVVPAEAPLVPAEGRVVPAELPLVPVEELGAEGLGVDTDAAAGHDFLISLESHFPSISTP